MPPSKFKTPLVGSSSSVSSQESNSQDGICFKHNDETSEATGYLQKQENRNLKNPLHKGNVNKHFKTNASKTTSDDKENHSPDTEASFHNAIKRPVPDPGEGSSTSSKRSKSAPDKPKLPFVSLNDESYERIFQAVISSTNGVFKTETDDPDLNSTSADLFGFSQSDIEDLEDDMLELDGKGKESTTNQPNSFEKARQSTEPSQCAGEADNDGPEPPPSPMIAYLCHPSQPLQNSTPVARPSQGDGASTSAPPGALAGSLDSAQKPTCAPSPSPHPKAVGKQHPAPSIRKAPKKKSASLPLPPAPPTEHSEAVRAIIHEESQTQHSQISDGPCSQRALMSQSQDVLPGSQQLTQEFHLSQPPSQVSAKERLEWLMMKRVSDGLWVQCDSPECGKWRYLSQCHDPCSLPAKWYCNLNPDPDCNSCDVPEKRLSLRAEEDMIFNKYSPGSVVWARLEGYPWWPAMVEDDPDLEMFYWINELSDIPTWYHVVFFDDRQVSRAWIQAEKMKKFQQDSNQLKEDELSERLASSCKKARKALDMEVMERLRKYSFVSSFNGPIGGRSSRKYNGCLGFRERASSSK